VVVSSDDEIRSFVEDLKVQPGGDIHLSGGARFAQTLVRFGLVEEFRFFVFPVYSPGASWFRHPTTPRGLPAVVQRRHVFRQP
jgi:dihydrofolate reductase